MARPTKLTPEIQRTICAALQAGNYATAACAMAGVSESTFYRWMERGERDSRGPYREFREAVERATARGEVSIVAIIRRAAEKEWRAAAWLAERRHPNRWGQSTKIEHAGKDGGPIETVTMTPNEAIAIMRARRQLLDAAEATEDDST